MRIIERCMHLDSKNRIWMGNGGVCAIVLDLNSFKIPVKPPKMQLDWIEIDEQFVDYRQLKDGDKLDMEFSGVARFYNYPVNLELPYNKNHLTFHFSAIDWSAPHKLRYSYKMVGINNNWSPTTEEAIADYRNMPYGTFTFVVRAIGEAQKWSDPFEYTFTINPPWWRSWWAVIIYCLLAFFILIAIIRFRERNLKQRSLMLEQQVEEKTLEILEQRKEVDELKSRFYANISHEFRTPLTLLVGPLEDSLKVPNEDVLIKKGMLHIMLRNARRLQRLINQLLDISKLESGNLHLKLVKGNLSDFVKAISGSFHSLAESRHISYHVMIEEAPGDVCFDPDKTEKIIINLLSNAFKFTPEGESVNLKLYYKASLYDAGTLEANIEIRDTGKGIGADQLGRIFERFYQVSDSDMREFEGTGIGLALTREMADLLHGKIDVESKLGSGTTFRVSFPVSEKCFTGNEISSFHPGENPFSGINLSEKPVVFEQEKEAGRDKRKLILVVEDNADLRKYIRDQLGALFRIEEAENGKSGLEKTHKMLPDLVITDLMMPEMGGIEMCEKLKTHPATNHIPVIMLTAKAEKESKIKGLETGADDYIIKPFDSMELSVRARNLILQRERLWESFRSHYLLEDDGAENSVQFKNLRELISVIDRHIDDPGFNLKILGEELKLSRTQLFRKIHNITGSTPNEIIRMVRMKRAASLIRGGELNVTQVMYKIGLKNPSFFASSFKKYYGVNPSRFGRSE